MGRKLAFSGLTGNQLKILALVAMTADHVGLALLPELGVLRMLGRLAFPIYGWMIAEGCRHTHDPRRYLGRLCALAAVCQSVYFLAMGSVYQCVLVSFAISALLCFAWQNHQKRGTPASALVFLAVVAGAFFVAQVLPELLRDTDYAIDYGFGGILLPLLVTMGRYRREKLAFLTLALVWLGLEYGGIQWLGLLAVPVLSLYNGQRGKRSLGRLFYLYYPAHLVVIYGIALLLAAMGA